MTSNMSSLPSTRVDHPPPDSIPTSRVKSRFYELYEDEEIWRDRYLFLLDHGLELRSRYRPGWTPSWLGTNLDPEDCEDSKKKTVSFFALMGSCTLLTFYIPALSSFGC
jgi:hypothetical protein